MDAGGLTVAGIDPGLVATGYGVVLVGRATFRAIEHGVVRPPRQGSSGERLLVLHRALLDLLRRCRPDAVAIEDPFLGANARSALALGQAQATAMLAAAALDIPVFTYAPARVKDAVAGYGRSDKRQVAEMVRMQLGMAAVPAPADAADALAVALCHAAYARQRLVELTP